MTVDAADEAERAGADAVLTGIGPAEPPPDPVGALFRAHALGLVRTAVLLLGDQASAEDVVQDVFARLQRSPQRLRTASNPVPYLRMAVINGCRSVHRSRRAVPAGTVVMQNPAAGARLISGATVTLTAAAGPASAPAPAPGATG